MGRYKTQFWGIDWLVKTQLDNRQAKQDNETMLYATVAIRALLQGPTIADVRRNSNAHGR